MTTTDKVYTGNSTTSSSSYTWTYNPSRQAEKGWECPRCGRINAPWVRQCDCSSNYTYITCTTEPYWTGDRPGWQKSDNCPDNVMNNPVTYQVGGSDYWNQEAKTYENVSNCTTNKVDSNMKIETWSNATTYPPNCHTPHYTTETCPNNICKNH